MRYEFVYVARCNMCGFPSKESKIMGKRLNCTQGFFPARKVGISTTVIKCVNCGLVFSNPMPIPGDIQQHYGVPADSYWKSDYFKTDPNYFSEQIITFNELYGRDTNLCALDIGAGVGKCMLALEQAGFSTFGIESSEPFYKMAIERMSIEKDHLKFCQLEEASYDENLFDFITFGQVLEHLYDPSESILKALNWLKPKGLIYIAVPSSAWLTSKIYNLVYKMRGLDYVSNISPMHSPFHLYEFGLESFKKHAEQHGYQIALHKHLVATTYLPKVLDPIVKPIMKYSDTGLQLEIWLQKRG